MVVRGADGPRRLEELPQGVRNLRLFDAGENRVLAYEAQANGTASVHYHLRSPNATGWTDPARFAGTEVPFRRAALAANETGLVAVLESTPDPDVRADILSTRQPLGSADLSVRARTKGISPLLTPVEFVVTNDGGTVSDASVATVVGPAGTTARVDVPPLAPGEQVTRTVSIQQPVAGTGAVRLATTGGSNLTTVDTETVAFPTDIRTSDLSDRLSTNRSALLVEFNVTNTGALPVRTIDYTVAIANQTVSGTVSGLGINQSRTVTVRFNASEVPPRAVATVAVDPNGSVPERHDGADARRLQIKRPDVGVVSDIDRLATRQEYGTVVRTTIVSGDTASPTATVRVGEGNRSAVYGVGLPAARASTDTAFVPAVFTLPGDPNGSAVSISATPTRGQDTDPGNDAALGATDAAQSNASVPALSVQSVETTYGGSGGQTVVVEVTNPTDLVVGELLLIESGNRTLARTTVAVAPNATERVRLTVNETATVTLRTVTETRSLEVTALDPIVGDDRPTDPDDDGRFEDLNGNGRMDFQDVVLLFNRIGSPAIADHPETYDFNRNGRLDAQDIVVLFRQT